MEAKQATLHHELIAQLLDSRIPKTEREHAAAREIERLRADILQELVDAPEPEPFGYFKSEPFGWTDCAETDDGAIALFAAPPAPSVPEPAAKVLHVDGLLSNNLIDCDLPVGTLLYTAPAAPVPARLVWDAERHQWLRTYNTAKHPAVAEEKKP